jgi:hypothetical protein
MFAFSFGMYIKLKSIKARKASPRNMMTPMAQLTVLLSFLSLEAATISFGCSRLNTSIIAYLTEINLNVI